MIKKDLTFDNLDGEKVTRSFWFNLNQAELAKLQLEHPGGYEGYVKAALDEDDTKEIIRLFDEILSMSYGVRDQDGITFRKDPQYWDSFKNTDAYSVLFMDLLTNPREAGLFFGGIVPKAFQENYNESMQKALKDAGVEDVVNVFDQANPALPASEELPQPEESASTVGTMLDGLTDEQKAELRAQLG